MSSPYSHLTDVQLIDELRSTDEYIKGAVDELGWLKHHDEDSGGIDSLEESIDHAVADYNWILKELFDRGFKHDTLNDTWSKLEA